MLDAHIHDDEYLYRRVILNPNFWDFENNRPSSAIFKDSKGVSVDRQHGRSDEEITNLNKYFEIRAIVKVLTKKCRDFHTFPVYKPLTDNVFHSEIHDSPDKIQLSGSKARKLRDSSILIFLNEEGNYSP